ncbi:MAG: MFS transporter [Acidisphaera sp.]|nr:MFS transporter [Acidisphaera sp.]
MTRTANAALTPARRWLAFAVLLAGGFLPPIDFFIVNVALPSIRTTLGATPPQVQLVISGYAAAFAAFLITGGRIGDLFGRKRLFVLSMAGFTATSALCGFATSPDLLVIGRVLEGLCAAFLTPQVLGSVRALFAGEALAKALSFYSAMIGLSAATGQFLGGALTAADIFGLGWRVVFLVNLPIGIVAVAAGTALVPETSASTRPRLDLGGVALASVGLLCLVLPLSEGPARGWPAWSIAMLAAFPFLLVGFLWFEDRVGARGGMPLLDLGLLRIPTFRRGVLVAMLFFFTSPFYLLFAIFEQAGLGLDALHTGLAIVPYGVGLFTGPLASAPLTRHSRRALFGIGMGIQVSGYTGVTLCTGSLIDGGLLIASLFIGGFGQGIAMPRLISLVLGDVSPHQAGLAAGVLNSMLQIGAAVSVAAIGSLFFVVLGSATGPEAYAHAMTWAMTAVTLALGSALLLGVI